MELLWNLGSYAPATLALAAWVKVVPPYCSSMTMTTPEPHDLTDPYLVTEYEDTTYEATIRRELSTMDSQGRGMVLVQTAPGEDGLRGLIGVLSSLLSCSIEEAEGLATSIAAAWLDAHGTKLLVTKSEETGARGGHRLGG